MLKIKKICIYQIIKNKRDLYVKPLKKDKMATIFFDIKNAYDKVNREKTLEQHGNTGKNDQWSSSGN